MQECKFRCNNMPVVKKNKYRTSAGLAYLTKRTLLAKAKSTGMLAEQKAVLAMGFTVKAIGKKF